MIEIIIKIIEVKEPVETPVVLPGSIIVLPSGRMLDVQHLGIDKNGMGLFYQGRDLEHLGDGKLELLHVFLEKFGYDQIIPPGPVAEEIRRALVGAKT
jgi:hypothetical protein